MTNKSKDHILLKEALRFCQSGNFIKARQIYNRLIHSFPNNLDLLVNFGVVEIQLNNINHAIVLFKKAIQVDSSHAYIHSNLGNALLEIHLYQEAIQSYDDAIRIDPSYYQAYYNKARCLKYEKNLEAAIENYMRAISIEPNYVEAFNNIGVILYEQKKYDEAINQFNKAISIHYGYKEAWNNLGLVYSDTEKFSQAIELFTNALKIDPYYTDALYNMAWNLQIIAKYDEALIFYDRLLKINPHDYLALYNKAKLLINKHNYEAAHKCLLQAIVIDKNKPEAYNGIAIINMIQNDFEESKKNLDIAINIDENFAEAYNSMGILYQHLNNNEKSVDFFKKSINLDKNYSQAKFNLSEEYLSRLNFTEGWNYFESRINKKIFIIKYKHLNKKYLHSINDIDSEDPIYIEAEQGIGDQILFLSLLSDLKKFKNKLYLKIDARLSRIFSNNFKELTFLSEQEDPSLYRYSYHISLGSMGMLFRPNKDSFSNQKPRYLDADRIKTSYLKKNLKKEGFLLCGLSWHSSNKNIGLNKSIQLDSFLPIFSLENLRFIDLQYGDTKGERVTLKNKFDIDIEKIEEIDNFNDIDGLFSLIDACDIVLTVSNVTAHIAGALGKKTFLLVPFRYGRIWYWHETLDRSLWYPSIRIYRQNQNGDWTSAINQIRESIKSN